MRVLPPREAPSSVVAGPVIDLPVSHAAASAGEPPADTLPDLAALPAFGFRIVRAGRRDMLDFNATV